MFIVLNTSKIAHMVHAANLNFNINPQTQFYFIHQFSLNEKEKVDAQSL